MKQLIYITVLFISNLAFGQAFQWQSAIEEIKETGYYDIELSAEMIGQLNHIYTDIRILDEADQEIAYISTLDKEPSQKIISNLITQKNTDKLSSYQVDFYKTYHFVAYEVVVKAPKLFIRKAVLKRVNRDSEAIKTMDVTLSSKKKNQFSVPSFGALESCILDVDNNDDVPLELAKVIGYQKKVTVTAPLEKGKTYRVLFGSQDLKAPVYDLAFFKDELPKKRKTIQLDDFQQAPKAPIEIEPVDIDVESLKPTAEPNYIWVVMGLVLFILGFMSWRMIKEMGKE